MISLIVSILARAEARALHIEPQPASALCRVSILARAEARALLKWGLDNRYGKRVSILARAEARALPKFHGAQKRSQIVSILARAEARALHWYGQHLTSDEWFQSSPAPRSRNVKRPGCFNPRPRRGAGAT